ncbi:hypothetical protein HK405_015243, partial [Cladochytrium tenue]
MRLPLAVRLHHATSLAVSVASATTAVAPQLPSYGVNGVGSEFDGSVDGFVGALQPAPASACILSTLRLWAVVSVDSSVAEFLRHVRGLFESLVLQRKRASAVALGEQLITDVYSEDSSLIELASVRDSCNNEVLAPVRMGDIFNKQDVVHVVVLVPSEQKKTFDRKAIEMMEMAEKAASEVGQEVDEIAASQIRVDDSVQLEYETSLAEQNNDLTEHNTPALPTDYVDPVDEQHFEPPKSISKKKKTPARKSALKSPQEEVLDAGIDATVVKMKPSKRKIATKKAAGDSLADVNSPGSLKAKTKTARQKKLAEASLASAAEVISPLSDSVVPPKPKKGTKRKQRDEDAEHETTDLGKPERKKLKNNLKKSKKIRDELTDTVENVEINHSTDVGELPPNVSNDYLDSGVSGVSDVAELEGNRLDESALEGDIDDAIGGIVDELDEPDSDTAKAAHDNRWEQAETSPGKELGIHFPHSFGESGEGDLDQEHPKAHGDNGNDVNVDEHEGSDASAYAPTDEFQFPPFMNHSNLTVNDSQKEDSDSSKTVSPNGKLLPQDSRWSMTDISRLGARSSTAFQRTSPPPLLVADNDESEEFESAVSVGEAEHSGEPSGISHDYDDGNASEASTHAVSLAPDEVPAKRPTSTLPPKPPADKTRAPSRPRPPLPPPPAPLKPPGSSLFGTPQLPSRTMSLKELASTFGPVVAPPAKAASTSAVRKTRPGHLRHGTDEDEDEDEWREHLRAAGEDAAGSDSDEDDGSSSDSDGSEDGETPRRNGVDKSRVAGSRKRKSGLFELAAD